MTFDVGDMVVVTDAVPIYMRDLIGRTGQVEETDPNLDYITVRVNGEPINFFPRSNEIEKVGHDTPGDPGDDPAPGVEGLPSAEGAGAWGNPFADHDDILTGLPGDPAERASLSLEASVAQVLDQLEDVLLRKHADYGSANISGSPGGPLNGLRVRMWDKLARINHLVDNDAEPANEPLRDSFLDLANYAIIALLVLDGAWPK